MRFFLFLLGSLMCLSSCKKDAETMSVVPEISFVSIGPSTVFQNKDSVIIRISYRDGDGDLGENNSDVKNAEITNFRNNLTYNFRIRQLAPSNANVAIQGELEFIVPGVAMENTLLSSESTSFSIKITDRAGNASNVITSNSITVLP
jgi:uncharacterized lipoprotein YajG